MIDCHAHLALSDFDRDRLQVLERAEQAGVTRIMVVGQDRQENEQVLEVCAGHARILKPCLGMHPDRFAEDLPLPTDAEIAAVCDLICANVRSIHGIGEVGLDYWRVNSERRRGMQARCLRRFTALSLETGLPFT